MHFLNLGVKGLIILVILFSNTQFSVIQEKKKPDLSERTFIMVKPDGVQRGLVGEIIKRFEQRGFHLVAMKFMQVIVVKDHLYFCVVHVSVDKCQNPHVVTFPLKTCHQ